MGAGVLRWVPWVGVRLIVAAIVYAVVSPWRKL
ncbi:hypothetical protein EDF23_101476 [Curtobacterium sp. PhB128]|nr:hypothetical protein EDF23_101476 [Curtobacterium sp. PhB128]TCL99158.1 hypothetical protein EDF29_101477 [Curtobacterium sp. PhB138]TCU84270.1 hypothetical protein EDF48_10688 [Curtobacterium sp. PhB191]